MILRIAVLAWLAYAAGLHWIYVSLHDFGGMPAWLSAIATLVLAAYVAAYAALSAYAVSAMKCRYRDGLSPWIVAAVVTLAEWLRGTLLTGFPWLAIGYLAIDTPLAGYAPILGVYGVVFVTVLCVYWLIRSVHDRHRASFLSLLIAVLAGWGLLLTDFTQPHGKPLRVALIQGAIPQSMKFDPLREASALQTHLQLASTAATPGAAQLIVLPETAVVRPWELLPAEAREAFSRIAKRSGAVVMLGAPLKNELGYTNSLIAIREDTPVGDYAQRYDKFHLVPFGEFIPWGFRWFVDMMNMPLGDFQRGAAVQKPLRVADQNISPNICFEDLFGEELIDSFSTAIPSADWPNILLNISNLAWFGNTVALPQHLAVSRMRALETGRPMIRATNTGATAVIDARGRVLERLPFGEEGVLATQVQGMAGLTPYARGGNAPIIMLSIVLAGLGAWANLKSRKGRKG